MRHYCAGQELQFPIFGAWIPGENRTAGLVPDADSLVARRREHVSISVRKSTPPLNRQLNISISINKQ